MSANATRGDFVLDYVVAGPRPRLVGGRLAMGAMIAVLLLALGATLLGRVGTSAEADSTEIMQGP